MNSLKSPHTQTILSALQWQGQRQDCGPFTTATIINAMTGLHLDAVELAGQMNRPVIRGLLPVIRRVPNWATFPWGMVDVLRAHGLNARWRLRAHPTDLTRGLERGDIMMPIIGSWKPLWAHVMTLLAWDEAQGWGFANTQFQQPELFWLEPALFEKQWQAMSRLLVEVRNAKG